MNVYNASIHIAIAQGFIETSWHKNRTPESYERINRKIALHRFGEISEVADMAYEVLKNVYNASIGGQPLHGGRFPRRRRVSNTHCPNASLLKNFSPSQHIK